MNFKSFLLTAALGTLLAVSVNAVEYNDGVACIEQTELVAQNPNIDVVLNACEGFTLTAVEAPITANYDSHAEVSDSTDCLQQMLDELDAAVDCERVEHVHGWAATCIRDGSENWWTFYAAYKARLAELSC